jgi:uroporphyrinogen-III synthase
VIIQRHGSVNIELDRALEARGARVAEVPTYRWSLPADTRPLERLVDALERKREQSLKTALNRTLVASIGPVASAALRDLAVNVGLESKPPKLGALMSALESALS